MRRREQAGVDRLHARSIEERAARVKVQASPVRSLFVLALLCLPATATAGARGPASEVQSPRAVPEAMEAPEGPLPDRHELAIVPVITANSDTGVGLGVRVIVAGFEEGYSPYRWRLEALTHVTIDEGPDGSLQDDLHNHSIRFDFPGALEPWLRLSGEVAYRQVSTANYYGIGNASAAAEGESSAFHQYSRVFPAASLTARFRLLPRLSAFARFDGTYDAVSPTDKSRLARDVAGESGPLVRSLLRGVGRQGILSGTAGLVWDTRSHELVPTNGMFHDVSGSGGGAVGADVGYGRVNATLRFYVPVHGDLLVVAMRVLGDVLFGDPPFYELARAGGLQPFDAPGGSDSIRGVPVQRFHGKVKVVSNLELRSMFWSATVLEQRIALGASAFVDTGRVFTDLEPRPELDGTGLGLAVGVGGGLRIQWGETFIARLDGAWSPDGVGFYVESGHAF